MTVNELIRLLEGVDGTLQIAVGSYEGPHNTLGWNETHEYSHGPIWVAEVDHNGKLRCFIGINCYGREHKNDSYRSVKNGFVVTPDNYLSHKKS